MSTSVSSSDRFPELEKYELAEEIGHGGMATVYRARDLRLDREVAVKLIHKHLRENPEVRRRFVSEAKAVAKLRHPGIVEVFDVSDDAEQERYLVVELIRGKSLRQVFQAHGALPAEVAACMVTILCDAVEHAHQHGVIHRDIKPENVLLELSEARPSDAAVLSPEDRASGETLPARRRSERPPSGRPPVVVKLTDFGIAKVLDAQGVTSTGQILGSPAHMAPEQIEGGHVGPHTDVFALGVLMYEAMVGHLPFEGKNPAQVLRRVLEGDYEPADAERPEVGGRWASILAGTLDIDLSSRLASAGELGALIDAELNALGIDDPHLELARYFDDPEAYCAGQREELVQRLLRRGERERRRGHAQAAASDFNRALALRPDDLAILKRVSTLSAQAAWRQRALWIGGIVAGSGALLGAAYGITRLVRTSDAIEASSRPSLPVPPVSLSAPSPKSAAPPPPSDSAAPSAEPSSNARPAGAGVAPAPPTPSSEPGKMRRVRFHVFPERDSDEAKLSIDGSEVVWFGVVREMEIGSSHQLRAWMPGDCCGESNSTMTVAADDPDGVQLVKITLPIKPATAKLVGGPPSALVTCMSNGLSLSKGGSVQVKMTKVVWSDECTFSPGDRKGPVTLRAGRDNVVRWPD